MVKINLANSLIAKSGSKTGSIQFNAKQMAIKVALLILPLVGVMFWEKKTLSDKQVQLATIKEQNVALDKKLTGFGAVDDMVRTVEVQQADLLDKLNVVRQIFGLRNQKMQTLFALQEKLPAKSWLTQVSFHEKTASVTGFATTIDEAGTFAESLGNMSELFSSVNTTSTNAEKVGGSEFFKFEIFIKLKE